METQPIEPKALSRQAYRLWVVSFLVMAAIFFIPAGTLAYWEAWLYMAVLLGPMLFVVPYMLKHSPQLLRRRMQMRERQSAQQAIIGVSSIFFLGIFVLPGLDQRFGWSSVPPLVVIAADALVLLGYGLTIRVLVENEYASRTIEVQEGQRVIATGPYAYVRHPMYLAVILMVLASPVALGSWWAALLGVIIVPILVARILNEEQVLARELPGYAEYRQKVRYRLVPGVW
ncbi:MAG TPA: isoprenylcysteine carboxylmethyltransferase family protein [Anaerolineales bacterium]|nr:isoprenylcysteine carboxylmethyltransferase family protein [Anaerolineales bacterium]